METASKFTPRRLGRTEFVRSNVFSSWSLRLGRMVEIVGPAVYDVWLTVEFDPSNIDYCERPPISLDLLNKTGSKRPIDFWVKRTDGRQYGIIVFDSRLKRDQNVSLDIIRSSIERSRLSVDIWSPIELCGKTNLIENLKFLRPFTATELPRDIELESGLVANLRSLGTLSWGELVALWPTRPRVAVNFAIARLIHAGQLLADLSGDLITNSTLLELP